MPKFIKQHRTLTARLRSSLAKFFFMNTQATLKFENNDGNEVHLVRDRLFWQAWEHSAFLFSKYFRKYQPHHKFIQKVAKDLVYLGFPKNVLSDLQLTSKQKGFVYEVIDDDHIVIRNVPNVDGYDEWKSGVLLIPKSTDQPKKDSKSTPKEQKKEAKTSEYLLYRLVFDFTVYASNLVPKINRIYRFPIGERLLNALVDVTEHVYLYINHINKLDCDSLVQSLLRFNSRTHAGCDLPFSRRRRNCWFQFTHPRGVR